MSSVSKYCAAALIATVIAADTVSAGARSDSGAFSIDLPVTYSRLADITHEICSDGIIHGTFEYEKETGISGATDTTESQDFPRWNGTGSICYKTRPQVIAPAHFVAANDTGTITVRYVVEPVDSEHAHIRIDAVFVEDSHRRRHSSMGMVEAAEFREIAKELKVLADLERRKQQEAERRERQKVKEAQEAKEKDLKTTLAALNQQLQNATSGLVELQERAEGLRRRLYARIAAPAAELKTGPLAAAETLEQLERGQQVTVLQRTSYWDRVRTANGSEGWVYSLLLEPLP
jgi:hypothetical protein